MGKRCLVLLILVMCFTGLILPEKAVRAAGNTYYISFEHGNDGYTGLSTSQPLKTVGAVNELDLQPGDSVLFFCGETWRGEAITIKDSGEAGNPITYGSYPGGCADQPLLSGAVPINGWYAYAGNIYAANLNSGANTGKFPYGVNQLFDGETRLLLGRWPNLDAGDGGYSTIDGHSGSQITDNQLPAADWSGASAHIRGMRWYILNREVTSSSGTALNLNQTPDCWGGSCTGWGFFINNHYNTLDQDGEWFYDKNTQRLYLYSTSGAPADGTIEGSVILADEEHFGRDWGGINLGRDLLHEGIHHVIVDNFALERWWRHGIAMPTNYAHREAYQLILRNNTIKDVDGMGISLAAWVWDATDGRPDGWRGGYALTIEANSIENANWMGIDTFSRESNFIDNTIKNIGLVPNLGASGLGCAITHTGGRCTEDGDGFRIKTDKSNDTGNNNLVQGNTIEKTAYNGMDIFGHSNTITENIILDACYVKGDCGAVRTFGSDNLTSTKVYDLVFSKNLIKNVIGNTDGCRDDFDALFGFGFYIDHYSRNITINNNTVSDATVHGVLYQNSTGQMDGNTLYNNSRTYPYYGAQVHITSSPSYLNSFTNNTMYSLRNEAYTLAAASTSSIGTSDYNKFFSPYRAASISVGGAKTLSEWQTASGKDSHSSEAWFSLNSSDAPLSTLFAFYDHAGGIVNLADRAYLDLDQNSIYGEMALAAYQSEILIDNGLAPLSLSAVYPAMIEVGHEAFTLHVYGTQFTNQSLIRFDGVDYPTAYVDQGHLTAEVPAAYFDSVKQVAVRVYDPAEGGIETTAANLWVVEEISQVYLPIISR